MNQHPPELLNLTTHDLQTLTRDITSSSFAFAGGQKIVYKAETDDGVYALKILPTTLETGQTDEVWVTDIAKRLHRECDTMRQCKNDHLSALGPHALTHTVLHNRPFFWYTEEWIDGTDLQSLLNSRELLTNQQARLLLLHISQAIDALWTYEKVHRDIKPQNIMLQQSEDCFILLDVGLAFDKLDESISQFGYVHGTVPYYSPEQSEFRLRRHLDFRSDLFSLGTTCYYLTTGQHPFWRPDMPASQCVRAISTEIPDPPIKLMPSIDPEISETVMRLLNKKPHQRYRSIEMLIATIEGV